MIKDVKDILISEEEIQDVISDLGKQISEDYKGKELYVVGILKGASIFMSDLVRKITVPMTMDFMAVSSYGQASESTGEVKIVKDLDFSVIGKDVLIVEDIIDTGTTLSYLTELLKSRGVHDVRICTLLDKPSRRTVNIPVDYVGFEVPNEFIVGYGIDYAEYYRNLPYVASLKEEKYK
ncbi:MAG: hypoxanthine phosphoribosyltransferase [Tissierellia bacterium]|nr:hypoxanthine phosphoribosyltransferase [Tissierellia bacterium]